MGTSRDVKSKKRNHPVFFPYVPWFLFLLDLLLALPAERCNDRAMSKGRFALITAALLAISLLFWHFRHHLGLGVTSPGQGESMIPWAEVSNGAGVDQGAYQRAQVIGTISDKRLGEVSGITASQRADDVWWVHNDSGDLPRIFAIDSTGKVLGEYRVVGAVNEDWEDIASGPGPDLSPALYIADIGDNSLSRDFVVVYRVREPDLTREDTTLQTAQAEAFQFRYPDGKHNAEALVVDPESGRMYVITKSDSAGCEVFRSPVPLKLGEPMTLERVVSDTQVFAQWRRVTGAATDHDGSRVVIRNYFSAFELHRAPGKDFESIFSATPAPINLPIEQQGEAVAYTRDGKALVTTSEGRSAPLNLLRRR
jgi:hypothetical protein